MIEIRNVCKSFKNNIILNDINMKLEEGNIYGFVGRNGSGKTVLLKIICGLYMPDSGSVLFDGENFNEFNKFVPNLRALIEKPTFFSDLTGYENLEALARIQNKIGKAEIEEALKIVNLYNEKNKKFSKYSLGMKQKLGIAQAIMEDPKILILDEPFTGLDPINVKMMKDAIYELQKEGTSIIFSSHQMEYIEDFCEKLVILVKGHPVVSGALKQIKEDFGIKNIMLRGEDLPLDKIKAVKGVLGISKVRGEIEVKIEDKSVAPKIFSLIKNSNITKYDVVEPTLNEIFIAKVGGIHE